MFFLVLLELVFGFLQVFGYFYEPLPEILYLLIFFAFNLIDRQYLFPVNAVQLNLQFFNFTLLLEELLLELMEVFLQKMFTLASSHQQLPKGSRLDFLGFCAALRR